MHFDKPKKQICSRAKTTVFALFLCALFLVQIAGATSKAKETIGSLPIPTAAKVVEIGLTDGSRIKLPTVETKNLEDLIKLMK